MGAYGRGQEIVSALNRAGIRATSDIGTAAPPVVLVGPPSRTYDVACGFTARWQLAAVAPAAQGPDRSSWAALEDLADAVSAVVDISDTEPITFVLNGREYPAFLLKFEEPVS